MIGIGTARRYDVGASEAKLAPLREVVRNFTRMGGKLIDTAPSYGKAEPVVENLVAQAGNRNQLFWPPRWDAAGRAYRPAGRRWSSR